MKNIIFYSIIGLFALLVLTAWKQDEPSFREDGNIKIEVAQVVASYHERYRRLVSVDLVLTDLPYENDSITTPTTYTYLVLYTYMPYDKDGKIATGTYEVIDTPSNLAIRPMSSYIINDDFDCDIIISGSMTVSEGSEENHYSIVCELQTEDGISVKCTYEGALVVEGMPEPSSTLKGNITVDLQGAIGTAISYGDSYGNGGREWSVCLAQYKIGEGLEISLYSEWGEVEDGIPSGRYKASSSYTTAIGEYASGFYDYGYYGTLYFEREYNNYLNRAPAISGDIIFTNNGDGTYKLEFACTDDAGYTWSGEWEGTITIEGSYNDVQTIPTLPQ